MRTITNTLLTAQTAASGRPHVRVEALDMLAGVARPNITRRTPARRRPSTTPLRRSPTAPSFASA